MPSFAGKNCYKIQNTRSPILNCTPFVRQYGILFKKWGVFVCQRDIESPLTTIRAYTEALLEGIAPDEAARQRYLQTIYARETDL